LVTVQLDPTADRPCADSQRQLAAVAKHLIGLMDSYRLPTTWAVSDPAHSAATPLILRSAVEHELAILGDAYWVGPTAGRTRFARELARRVLQARAAGVQVASFVPRVATVERHIDLIVKQRISAIAGVVDAESGRQSLNPRALHYGVWELPVTASLPVKSTWFSSGRWSSWRQIRGSMREATTFHLAIDAAAIAEDGRRAEKTVAWLMRRVADMRNRGLVQVETLRAASGRLSAVPASSPQHSILRSAA
jgi:hypothetical protein